MTKLLLIDPQVKTTLYGSCATGLALNTSDVDIALHGLAVTDRTQVIEFLKILQEKLENFRWIKAIQPIFTANIPVLKLVRLFKRKLADNLFIPL